MTSTAAQSTEREGVQVSSSSSATAPPLRDTLLKWQFNRAATAPLEKKLEELQAENKRLQSQLGKVHGGGDAAWGHVQRVKGSISLEGRAERSGVPSLALEQGVRAGVHRLLVEDMQLVDATVEIELTRCTVQGGRNATDAEYRAELAYFVKVPDMKEALPKLLQLLKEEAEVRGTARLLPYIIDAFEPTAGTQPRDLVILRTVRAWLGVPEIDIAVEQLQPEMQTGFNANSSVAKATLFGCPGLGW